MINKRRNQPALLAAVRRGIKLLDVNIPGWRKFVSVEEFDFTHPCRCVLGQIGGARRMLNPALEGDNWAQGKTLLSLDRVHASPFYPTKHYGFDWEAMSEGPYLAKLWLQAIRGEKV